MILDGLSALPNLLYTAGRTTCKASWVYCHYSVCRIILMSDFSIYHNPRCSKSRQTLSLLQEHGVEPDIILYLDIAIKPAQLKALLSKLAMGPRELLRKGEADYKEQGLADKSLTDTFLIKMMCQFPKLIERPIVVSGNKAILGRPPENALTLIK